MDANRLRRAVQRPLVRLGLAAAAAMVLAGCGTPAVVKPVATPLPGFAHDIHAAQSVVSQAQQAAQEYGATGVGGP